MEEGGGGEEWKEAEEGEGEGEGEERGGRRCTDDHDSCAFQIAKD